jgi:PAS domain-containing protein
MAGSVSEFERDWLAQFAGMRLRADAAGVASTTVDTLLGALHRVHDLVYFIDPQGQTSRFSPKSLILTGVAHDRLGSEVEFIRDLVHPDDRTAVQTLPTDGASAASVEYRLRSRDASPSGGRQFR